jgi:hypothetical protein
VSPVLLRTQVKLGIVGHTCNPSTWETKAGELQVQGQVRRFYQMQIIVQASVLIWRREAHAEHMLNEVEQGVLAVVVMVRTEGKQTHQSKKNANFLRNNVTSTLKCEGTVTTYVQLPFSRSKYLLEDLLRASG